VKKLIIAIGLIAIVLLLSFARFKGMGAGLRVIAEAVPCNSPGCFEGISHFEYLYDGSTKISQVDKASVSPSGKYAAFSDFDGRVMLYKRGSNNPEDVTSGRNGLAQTFVWDEAHSKVTVNFCEDNGCPPLIVHLDSPP
jgi:hypothetical protein